MLRNNTVIITDIIVIKEPIISINLGSYLKYNISIKKAYKI